MSKGLELVGGEEASETARFVGMIDQFFDALNVHNYHHGVHSRKPFQEPYTKGDDPRLKVHLILTFCTIVLFVTSSGLKMISWGTLSNGKNL